MKKLIAVLLLIVLVCSIPCAQADTAQARLNQRIATRSGPGTRYFEPGSFLKAGDYVTVHTKVWDDRNEIWWVQVEFEGYDGRYRAYTGAWRMDVDLSSVPEEAPLWDCYVTSDADVFAGPGWDYVMWNDTVYDGTYATLYEVENGYGLIECWNGAKQQEWRVWADLDDLSCGWLYDAWEDTYPDGGNAGSSGNGWRSWAIGEMCTITGGIVNCRVGTGENYQSKAYVYRGDRYDIYDAAQGSDGSGWYQIYVNGQYLWISADWANVDGTSTGTGNSTASGAWPIGEMCTITDGYASCHSGVGTSYPVVTYVYQGDPCYIHDCQTDDMGQDWYKIYAGSQCVWIESGATSFGSTSSGNQGGSGFPIGEICRIVPSSGNARAGAGVEYAQVEVVYEGEYYEVLDTDVASNGRTWYKIRVRGQYAWISSGIASINGMIY